MYLTCLFLLVLTGLENDVVDNATGVVDNATGVDTSETIKVMTSAEQEITASVARGTSLESNDGTFLSNRPMKLTLINC